MRKRFLGRIFNLIVPIKKSRKSSTRTRGNASTRNLKSSRASTMHRRLELEFHPRGRNSREIQLKKGRAGDKSLIPCSSTIKEIVV
jgi:hypothetical protein